MKRNLAILGSTGSIGTQALEVVSEHPDLFEVYALTANNQVDLLINQARKYMPEVVVIANEQKYPELKEALEDLSIKVWAGSDAIAQVVQSEPIDMVLTAMVGYAGLKPTIAAIKAGKAIALANKETLVVAGELITALAVEHKVPILPVDSEHSAIFQCLAGEWENPVEKILLTASGGPFRTKTMEELAVVTKAQALKHPNWSMGAKITIDSASMMNKGLEIIEEMRRNNEKVIFLVPHGWAVDIPAMLMASQGQKMAAMFHNQGNPVFDYVWNTVRRRFGGRLHARNDGIKPFIQSVRQGYWGYYLPDQDHGPEHSEFVDFFATYKATLPAIGRLMKVCRARVVPLFPIYDGKTHRLTIQVRPPMDDLLEADDHTIARRMNEEVEIFVGPRPEQYTWILKLLKTRKPGEIQPYKRKDLYPIK